MFEEVRFTEANFHETILLHDQLLKRHRNGGGWVPVNQNEYDESKPFVSSDSYVDPYSWVTGASRVESSQLLDEVVCAYMVRNQRWTSTF